MSNTVPPSDTYVRCGGNDRQGSSPRRRAPESFRERSDFRRVVAYSVAVLTLALSTVRDLPAQDDVRRVVVSSEIACAECTLTLDRVARLGSSNGREGLGGTARLVATDSRGRYYVVDINTAPSTVAVFNADGTFRQLIGTLGRRGQGPGEFSYISQMFVMPGDSLRIDDVRNRRFTILSPDYRVIRTAAYPGAHFLSTILFDDGYAVTSKRPRTPREAVGFPLHRVDASGNIVRSFGFTVRDTSATAQPTLWRSLTPSRAPGRFHAAHTQSYIIEEWDTAGRKFREIVRDASWFHAWTTQPHTGPDAPAPQPRLFAVFEDGEHRLWTFVTVPQPDWKQYLHRLPVRDGEPNPGWSIGGVTLNTGFDTIVEVIDLSTGRLLVSQRFDQVFFRMFDGGRVYSDGEDAEGASYVDIWQLRLQRRAP
jgi:hypothetical protein